MGGAVPQGEKHRPKRKPDKRALPNQMDQRAADRLCQRGHLEPPSIRSSSFSIASKSAEDDFLVARACITSALTEPPNARCTRSRTRWRWVCSREYFAR